MRCDAKKVRLMLSLNIIPGAESDIVFKPVRFILDRFLVIWPKWRHSVSMTDTALMFSGVVEL
jgi:hypothetical protein